MIDLSLQNIAKSFGAYSVLTDVSFALHTRERVGLIGANGTGKTTVFRLITNSEFPDKGQVSMRKGLSIGYLAQIPQFPQGYKVHQILDEAFSAEHELADRLRDFEQSFARLQGKQLRLAMEEYGRLQQQYEEADGYQIPAKIDRVCHGLRIGDEMRNREFQLLSGGEQSTVMLAQLLLTQPDLLLLDEPSNHLDVQSLEWLEEYLGEYPGTLCVISHDRYFLDRVVSRIIEIEDGRCHEYLGNYSYYTQEKARRLQEQLAQYQTQQKKISAMEQSIRDLKDWGNRADNPKFHKRAASMQKRLDKMDKMEKVVLKKPSMQLDFQDGGRTANDVFVVTDLCFAYGDTVILEGGQLHVHYSERVALLGSNGSGKSTLLKLLVGTYQPQSGEVKRGARARLGYCEQHVVFPNEERTVLQTFRDAHATTEGEARNLLAKFLFTGEDVFKNVKDLSGGERSRLRLCQLMQQDLNVLVLDEPTNHLDIAAMEVLEAALQEFRGTIIFVSHDRYFINKMAERVVELAGRRLRSYVGDYDYYRRKKQEQAAAKADAVKKPAKPARKLCQKATKTNHHRLDQLEKDIAELEERIAQKRAEAKQCATDYTRLWEIEKEIAGMQQRLDALLGSWLALVE